MSSQEQFKYRQKKICRQKSEQNLNKHSEKQKPKNLKKPVYKKKRANVVFKYLVGKGE